MEYYIVNNEYIKGIAGIILCIWGYIDGIKYHFEAQKIKINKSSKGRSRKFILMALSNDLYRILYFFFVDRNYYVIATSVIALFFMLELFYQQYKFYPYRMRGCSNFKRPNIFLYLLNSLLPNSIRRRL